MALIIKPLDITTSPSAISIFLAGSIDTHDWQKLLTNQLDDLSITFFNPRRDNWRDDLHGDDLRNVIDWELDKLDKSDLIIFFLDPSAKNPASLLEIGLYATSKKIFICWPRGFWRRTYMQLFCQRYSIPLYSTLSDLIIATREYVNQFVLLDSTI